MKTLTEKDIAVVVPLSSREELTHAEEISLRHLRTYLGRYDKYFVAADKLKLDQVDKTGFEVVKFPDRFFGSVRAHNKLLTSVDFYKTFSKYKYILIYHLDALAFSDQLLDWCNKGYDFVAPPWMFPEHMSWLDKPRVGNGGFSIRNVENFIKLYTPGRHWKQPEDLAQLVSEKMSGFKTMVYYLGRLVFRFRKYNNIDLHLKQYLDRHNNGEDAFVSFYAEHYVPGFKIASPQTALDFAFEVEPRKCFELNNHRMPFGCHAFERYDRPFWEPYILNSDTHH